VVTKINGLKLDSIRMREIGSETALRARSFSVRRVYTKRIQLGVELETAFDGRYLSLYELPAGSDFIALHLPVE
jgi:lactate dehydrogenase-like 2-hydroxyacid dehydrogenase